MLAVPPADRRHRPHRPPMLVMLRMDPMNRAKNTRGPRAHHAIHVPHTSHGPREKRARAQRAMGAGKEIEAVRRGHGGLERASIVPSIIAFQLSTPSGRPEGPAGPIRPSAPPRGRARRAVGTPGRLPDPAPPNTPRRAALIVAVPDDRGEETGRRQDVPRPACLTLLWGDKPLDRCMLEAALAGCCRQGASARRQRWPAGCTVSRRAPVGPCSGARPCQRCQ
jgi:hypothetical protein